MSDDKVKTAAITAFTQYMSTHKLRKTPERYAILESVFDMASHFVVEMLYDKLDESGYHVSKATIYNTLLLLTDAGLVRRHTFAGQTTQFEKIVGITNHHHLVCSRCGNVKEIKDSEIDAMLSTRRYGSFHPIYIDLHIYGLCSRCIRKSKKPKRQK